MKGRFGVPALSDMSDVSDMSDMSDMSDRPISAHHFRLSSCGIQCFRMNAS